MPEIDAYDAAWRDLRRRERIDLIARYAWWLVALLVASSYAPTALSKILIIIAVPRPRLFLGLLEATL